MSSDIYSDNYDPYEFDGEPSSAYSYDEPDYCEYPDCNKPAKTYRDTKFGKVLMCRKHKRSPLKEFDLE